MKKILTLLTVLLGGALLVSCGNTEAKQPSDKPATTEPGTSTSQQGTQEQPSQAKKDFDDAKATFLDALDNQLKPNDQPAVIQTSVQLSNLFQDKYTVTYDVQQDAEYLKVIKSGDFETLYINTAILTTEEKSLNIVATFTSKDDQSLTATETYPVKAVNNTTATTIKDVVANTTPSKDQLISLSNVKVIAIMGRTVVLQSQEDGAAINVYDKTEGFGKEVELNGVYTFIGFKVSQYNNNNQLLPSSPAVIKTGTSTDVVAQPASIKYLTTVTDANFLGNSLINNKLLLVNAKVVVDKKSKAISLQDPTDQSASITVSKYISKDTSTALMALDGQTANLYVTKYAYDGGKFQAAVLATDAPALTEDQNKVVALYNEAAKLNLDVNDNNDNNSQVFAATKDDVALSYAFPEGEEHANLTLSGTYPVSGLQANQIVNLVVSVTLSKDGVSVTLPINSKLGHSDVVTELSAFYGETKPSGEVNVQGVVTAKIKYGFVISSTDSKYNILLSAKSLNVEFGKEYKFTGVVDFSHGTPQLNNVTIKGDAQDPSQVPGAITVTVEQGVDPKYDFALLTINNVKYLKTDKYGALFEGANGLNYQIYIKGTTLADTQFEANALYNLVNVRQSGIDTKHGKVNLSVNTGISSQVTSVSKATTESSNTEAPAASSQETPAQGGSQENPAPAQGGSDNAQK